MFITPEKFLEACLNTDIDNLNKMLYTDTSELLNFYKEKYSISDFYDEIHPFRRACSIGNVKLIDWLKIKNFNITDEDWFVGLKLACNNNQFEIIELLFRLNPYIDINGTDKEYEPIILTLCKNNNYEVLKFLIEIIPIIDINSITQNDHEIFRYVCENNFIEFANLIIKINDNYSFEINEEYGYIDYSILKIKVKLLPDEDVEDCPICFKKSNIISRCNHQFCEDCIKKWKKESNRCPICRKELIIKYKIE